MSSIGDPIIVGYIDSPEGKAALDRAIVEAQYRKSRLVVVHSQGHPAGGDVIDGIEVDETLDPVAAFLHDKNVAFEVRNVTESGDPADDLILIAEEVAADLIVIGLRKRTAVGKLILGSNAQRILLQATCPVLAVKAPP